MSFQEITLVEALCGFKRVITHLDDRQLLIAHPPGQVITHGELKSIVNEGMPQYKNPFEKGHLFIKFNVKFPENNFASPEQLLQLEKLLPPRPPLEKAEGAEDVLLTDFDESKYKQEQQVNFFF